MGFPTPDVLHRLKYLSNPTTVAYTGTQGRTAVLVPGLYELVATTNCYFLQGAVGVEATTSSNPLPAWAPRLLYVETSSTEGYVSAIRDSVSGTLFVIKRES